MKEIIQNFLRDEQGQDLVEYTLLLAFVALAAAGVMSSMGGSIGKIFNTTNAHLSNAAS